MSSEKQSVNGIPLGILKETIGIFSLVGIGIGLTGGITLSQLGEGGGIFGGFLILVVLTFAFLIGPLIAVITGLRTGEKYGQSYQAYIAGGAGAVGGYFSMMLIVLSILSLAMIILSGDGGSGATTAQSAASSSTGSISSSGIDIGKYITPVIAVSIPTAISGLGGVFFAGDSQDQIEDDKTGSKSISSTKLVAAVAAIAIIGAAVGIIPAMIPSTAIDLTVSFDTAEGSEDALIHVWTVENPTDQDISTTMISEMSIDGETIATKNKQITVPARDQVSISFTMIEFQELTDEQMTRVRDTGNYSVDHRFDVFG